MLPWYFTSFVLCAFMMAVIRQQEAFKFKFWEKNKQEECPQKECPPVADAPSPMASECPKITAFRRYDIKDMGYEAYFRGWVDVQGQGAANDYCRFVGDGKGIHLACALAGTQNESDQNYVSQKTDFDRGYMDTWYMKDEDNDGRDDYCRCVGSDVNSQGVMCTKAGSKGFYGSAEQKGDTMTFSPTGKMTCEKRKVRPEFGRVYASN